MVALWIRAGTALLRRHRAGGAPARARWRPRWARVLLWRAAEDLLPGRGAGVAAAVLANATLLFGAGAVTMTPDTPLLFFWTAALFGLRPAARHRPGGLVGGGRAWRRGWRWPANTPPRCWLRRC